MDIEYIHIKNFKGIKDLKIHFSVSANSRFYTFVGLNESGKTTILEAINSFCYGPERMEGLNLDEVGKIAPEDMIPISQRSNFNGKIGIAISVLFPKKEIDALKKMLSTKYPQLKITSLAEKTKVTYVLDFANSKLDTSTRLWDFELYGRQKNERKPRRIYDSESAIWQDSVKFLSEFFPDIVYFPNFLFDLPNRIYLDSSNNETDIFYCKLLQDILDSLQSKCSLKTHILERMINDNEENKRNLRAVLLEMERELTKTIFTSWNSIFGGNSDEKKIHLLWGEDTKTDDPQKGKYYIEFQLEDANGQCKISERSLGFRWFFVFRLLTYYRGHRNSGNGKKKVLFLLDEPASNLHPAAQNKLLNCLADLPLECQLIYTTHSHHLINPQWLDNAYIIKNEALNYETKIVSDYSAKHTKISATRFRDFVGQHPEQTCYFKPILDVLDYAPSQLEFSDGGVLIEGKNDYYVLNYMKECLRLKRLNLKLIPGRGCNKLAPLIQLYSGWGKNFCILLDSDEAGIKSKEAYEKEWESIVEGRLFTYADVNNDFSDKALESMFSDKDKELVYNQVGQPQNQNKKAFNRALQELWIKKEFLDFEKNTKIKFNLIFNFLKNFFKQKK